MSLVALAPEASLPLYGGLGARRAMAAVTRYQSGYATRMICINAKPRQICDERLMNAIQTIGLVLLAEALLTLVTAAVAEVAIHTGAVF